MLEVLLTAVPALCWLLCRCYHLLQTPLATLFQKLNIDIPHAPQVTIDSLGEDYVILHWDTETASENIYYVVLLNGREAATLAGKLIKLCGLQLAHMYLVRVLAVNAATNFRSQSGAVYVTTTDSKVDFDDINETPGWAVSSWTDNMEISEKDAQVSYDPNDSSPELLRRQIRSHQLELHRTKADMAAFALFQQTEMLLLLRSYNEYKYVLSEEHEQRGRKDLDVKELEKKKDSLTFEKLKLLKQLRNHRSHKLIHKASLAELRSRVTKLEEKKHHVLNTADLERARVKTTVEQLHRDITELKEQLTQLENNSKQLNGERKDLSHQVNLLKPLVDQFTVFNPQPTGETSPNGSQTSLSSVFEVFTRDSLLTKGGAELLKRLTTLRPEWEGDINREFEALTALELSWKSAYRNAIRKFVMIHNNAEVARASANPGYQPQKITEYQASVEFGGFSNALPKSRPPKVYTFIDEHSPAPDSPASGPVSPPIPETERMAPFYSRVYDEHDNNLGSLVSEAPPMARDYSEASRNMEVPDIMARDYSEAPRNRDIPDINMGRDYSMSQSNSLNVPMMASSSSLAQNQQAMGYNSGHQQSFSQSSLPLANLGNNLNQGMNVPLEPSVSGSLIQASLLGPLLQNQDSLLQFLFPLQSNLQPGMQQDRSHHLQSNLNDSLQPGLQQNLQQMQFLSGLPYEDQMYGMRSPTPENPPFGSSTQQSIPSLWNTPGTSSNAPGNTNTGGFLNSRQYPKQMSLSPGPMNTELSPSQSIVSQPNDALLDSLLLSNNSQLPGSSLSGNLPLNIWLDRLNPGLSNHGRALSGGNHIWRNDVPSGMISPDFQPFQSRKKERDDSDDIQLL